MKVFQKISAANAVIFALIFLISFANVAEAKGGYTKAYRNGFSSQRQSASRPVMAYESPVKISSTKTAFGSFGNTASNQSTKPVAQSQLGKDLSANAAQTNALKTAEARNANNNTNSSANRSGWGGQNGEWNGVNNQQPVYSQPMIHQTVVHQHGGGFMSGLMWFMIGHSMAQHNNIGYVPSNAEGHITYPQGDIADGNNMQGVSEWSDQQHLSPVEEKESFFMKSVRVLLWIGVIAGMIWLIRKIKHFRNRFSNKSRHYSLGS